MTHNQNSNAFIQRLIHDRVGENSQRENSSSTHSWCTKARVLSQKRSDTFEFLEKAHCYYRASPLAVKIKSISKVVFRPRVERVAHCASLARSRAMACSPGTATARPDSISDALRSASNSQACSISLSESILAINRSNKRDRSAGASCRTSASRTSKLVLTITSNAIGALTDPSVPQSRANENTRHAALLCCAGPGNHRWQPAA